jgi:hypothetical protein
MALINSSWNRISIHRVVLEFLRGEREKIQIPPAWLPVLETPNLDDPLENQKRLRLLYIPRGKFMIEIPPDTKWWEVKSLTENELGELYTSVNHTQAWDNAGSKLEKVAAAVELDPLRTPPGDWPGRIIPWGHNRNGPFSIMEGNHRLISYMQTSPRPRLQLEVYVGISPSYCYWHYGDPDFCVGTDLFDTKPQMQFVVDDWIRRVK